MVRKYHKCFLTFCQLLAMCSPYEFLYNKDGNNVKKPRKGFCGLNCNECSLIQRLSHNMAK